MVKQVWFQVLIIALFLVAGMLSPMANVDAAVTGAIFGVATLNAPGLLKWSGNHATPPIAQLVIILLFLAAGMVGFKVEGIDRVMSGALIGVAVASAPALLIPPSSPPPAAPPSNLPLPPPGGAA